MSSPTQQLPIQNLFLIFEHPWLTLPQHHYICSGTPVPELHTVFKGWAKHQFIQCHYDILWFVLCSLLAFGLPFFDHYFTLSWPFLVTICHNPKTSLLRSHHPPRVHYFMWKAQMIFPLVEHFMFNIPMLNFMVVSHPVTQTFLQLFTLGTFTCYPKCHHPTAHPFSWVVYEYIG